MQIITTRNIQRSQEGPRHAPKSNQEPSYLFLYDGVRAGDTIFFHSEYLGWIFEENSYLTITPGKWFRKWLYFLSTWTINRRPFKSWNYLPAECTASLYSSKNDRKLLPRIQSYAGTYCFFVFVFVFFLRQRALATIPWPYYSSSNELCDK